MPDFADIAKKRELGDEAVWTISTAKPGNGVEQLRDNNIETYWQSDGTHPHIITIQFLRKVSISDICIYLDYVLDESYTPKKISIKAGSSAHDLVDVANKELSEPSGWIHVELVSSDSDIEGPLRAHLIQIHVLSMHQNGRDTHIRQVKLYGPRASPRVMGNFSLDMFHTIEM
eukprot:CAMPEP_0185033218 /NCGR_PEP_ID=MMETSP1103-20130426/21991_1 /TAXON_ID=36769 /ORGANISM="Paraphysomonas bandaiensis, Strain Caron Lab Isolate" /LENGTH=172 /DNA_ID=CAMNT_0027569419 /DNA_START=81 /DNA_END=596 /DNA_ORIENTATION=+